MPFITISGTTNEHRIVRAQEGINDYLIGEWWKARTTLTKCLKQIPGDRPALRIFQARPPRARAVLSGQCSERPPPCHRPTFRCTAAKQCTRAGAAVASLRGAMLEVRTCARLQVIQDLKFTCPKDWHGFRELTSK